MAKMTKAEIAYRRLLFEDWRPTSREFDDALEVGQQQGGRIRRTIKEMAAEDGHVFGYHPELNCLMIAPHGNINDTQAIIDYAARSAARAIGGLQDQIRGAAGGGVVTKPSAKKARDLIGTAQRDIEDVVATLRWREVVDA